MIERTTVRLPAELLARVRRKAAAESVSMTHLIEEGLRRVLSETRTGARSRRTPPPVSMASGGLMPGIVLHDTAALEESDDLARPGRQR
ncbi:MAG TPA: ribbon-helix-helix protein, CopG family [Rhizomicrobium sp.]